MKISKEILPMALHYLKGNDKAWERIKTDYPTQLADLTSWKENPDCACGGRVVKFFADKAGELDKYIDDEEKFDKYMDATMKHQQENLIAGTIVEIPKGDAAFAAFFQTLNGKQFQMFSVVERQDTVALYFL
jgi:hypothetical protein